MLGVTRHGIIEIVVGTIVLAVLGALLGWLWAPLSLIVLPVWVWLIAFFRDPERPISTDPNLMVSPADGMVSDITEIPHSELLEGPCVRVGIFLSVFNVHVNRAPCDAKVLDTLYKKGKFINALKHDEASDQNESNTIVLGDVATSQPIAVVKQIVGLIARRIVCDAKIGDVLKRGGRIGMIKFGSRTELYIPTRLKPTVLVTVGQKVRGGADVLAKLG